ncbi:Hypothetical protein KVN_LOCUS127 [uncultured virus]|nr:Hypothetical protein KVN_LOCUS127 [uncultured virus]
MKILITSYYGPNDSLYYAEKALEKKNFEVVDYPLFKFYMDKYDKLVNYIDHFTNFIIKEKPDIILWWYVGIPSEHMVLIKNKFEIKHIFFNWDEPYSWNNEDMKYKVKIFDCVFACCEETLNKYIIHGVKDAFFCLPGYDPTTHYVIEDINQDEFNKYKCDISFCCTNLYENTLLYPDQYINRKKLLDDIYLNQDKFNYIFNIYGPNFLENLYPKSYKGFINYKDTNKLFNYSKINLCTHVSARRKKSINERTLLILGSGGLLLIDHVNGLEELVDINNDCILLNKNNYLNQINQILTNYNNYKIIKKNAVKKSLNYTWNVWACNINNYLNKNI